MSTRHLLSIIAFCCCAVLSAQQTKEEDILNEIHAFKTRNYPDDGVDIIRRVILQNNKKNDIDSLLRYHQYKKTAISVLVNKDSIQGRIKKRKIDNDYIFRKIILPFESWLAYAKPNGRPGESELTAFLTENYQTIVEDPRQKEVYSNLLASRYEGFYKLIGQQNVEDLLELVFGDINLFDKECQLMLLPFINPLGPDALSTYQYHILGTKQMDNQACSEIAFYSLNPKTNAFSGYLYVSTDGEHRLVRALFTLNNPEQMNFVKHLLITHTYISMDKFSVPYLQESRILLGDPQKGGVSAQQLTVSTQYSLSSPQDKSPKKNKVEKGYDKKDSLYWEHIRPVPLSASQTQVEALVSTSERNRIFTSLQDILLTLMSNHITVGGIDGSVEFGPLSQLISYNNMEGIRLKMGGNTNVNLINRLQAGGYVAYGTADGKFKYRGDLTYSFLPRKKYIWEYPKQLLNFTYVNDLNIPGQDLLTTKRDNFLNSFSHTPTNNMSLQKIGVLSFEQDLGRAFSYKVGGKYLYDRPIGVVQYLQTNGADTTVVDDISTTEVTLSLSFSPGQRFIQNRDKRIIIQRGEIELKLNHRIGIKGALGSDYTYQITDFSAHKKVIFNKHVGSVDIHASGGKVWNRVPFPLLFIPIGNQSYIFRGDNYNCMNFYEFATDRYVAGAVNFMFNWSPVSLFNKKSKIQLSMGARMIYGPLSDNNNPELHPELFLFNQGVKPLGKTPYAEINVGLANLFKILRVEYARRLTYLTTDEDTGGNKIFKGSLLVTGSFAF